MKIISSERYDKRRQTLGVVNMNDARSIFSSTTDQEEDDVIECVREKPKKNDPVLLSARTLKLYDDQTTTVEWRSTWSSEEVGH